MDQVTWARELAERLLAEPLPRRWAHTQGVAARARSIEDVLGDQAETLVAAAWVHDIGYAPLAATTGLHPLDGARYLRDIAKANPLICSLVAHHSSADVEARNCGLADELLSEFPPVEGLINDALTYCDVTTTPDGEPTDVESRLDEVIARYGEGHLVTRTIQEVRPQLVGMVNRVTALLGAAR